MSDRPHQRRLPPCERCKSPIESGDLRCAVCALPVPHRPLSVVSERVAHILRCQQCNAAVAYDVEAEAPVCAFCGSVADIEITPDPPEEADLYLPFRIDEAAARGALQEWLRGLGFLRPSALSREATLDQLRPLYWVGWTFEVEALVSYTGDSPAGSRRSDWAPHAGQRAVTVRDVLVSASRGLNDLETRSLWPYFDLTSARPGPLSAPADPADLADPTNPADDVSGVPGPVTLSTPLVVERFDVRRSAAREIITKAVHDHAHELAHDWVPGNPVRNLDVAVLPRKLRTQRYAFPTYVLAYRYRDRVYRALVHGQNANCVVGKAPWSLAKIGALVAAGLALLALLWWFTTG